MTDINKIFTGPIAAAYLEVPPGTFLVLAAECDAAISALQSRLDAAEAENGRLQADRDRANKYANQAALELDGMRQQLSERDAVLRDWYPGCGLTARQTQALRERTDALLSSGEPVKNPLQAEVDRLNQIINTPQADDFLRAVSTEAEHQRQRWGSEHDDGKAPSDWFWLIGYLAGKALHAHGAGNVEKAEHHVITTAAALANWHRAMFGKTDMRPGISSPACSYCGGSGQIMVGRSGDPSDGNAPIMEPCEDCEPAKGGDGD